MRVTSAVTAMGVLSCLLVALPAKRQSQPDESPAAMLTPDSPHSENAPLPTGRKAITASQGQNTPAGQKPTLARGEGRGSRRARWFETFIAWQLYIRNPVPLPGFIASGHTPAARRLMAKVYARELAVLDAPGAWHRMLLVLAWAGVMTRSCLLHYAKHRPVIRRELPDTGDIGHLWRLLICVFVNNISPMEFYRYKFYRAHYYRQRRHYLLRWHLDLLLVQSLPVDDSANLADKHYFWQTASRAGLAVVPVVALVHKGVWLEGSWSMLAAADLVIKPTCLARGTGVEFLDAKPGGGWERDAQPLTDAEARSWIESRSHGYPVILQPRAGNHPALARYGTEGLATLRIVTMKTRGMAHAICLASALRIPQGSGRLANLHQGALVCSVDPASGRMSAGAGVAPACENLTNHPVTGAPLAGEYVPFWHECKALCIAGHGLAPNLNSAGWDVIITPEGPRLLEANLRWGSHVLQIAGGTPLLATRFPELYESPD